MNVKDDSRKVLKDRLSSSLGFDNIVIEGDLASVKELSLGDKKDGVNSPCRARFFQTVLQPQFFRHKKKCKEKPPDYKIPCSPVPESCQEPHGKDVYDKYIKDHFVKFFAYSEKWTPSTGYVDETAFHFEIEDGIVRNVRFLGGCNGNLQGIGKLVEGMKIEDVIEKLEGLNCNGKGTSCPDQLAQALKEVEY